MPQRSVKRFSEARHNAISSEVFGLAGRPRWGASFFREVYFGTQPSGILKPKALAMSIWAPTNGVICFAFPVCSTHLIERISSSTSRVDENCLCRSVDFHMWRTYELRISPTKRISSLPVLPSSDQLRWRSKPSWLFICWKYFSCSSRSPYNSQVCIAVMSIPSVAKA